MKDYLKEAKNFLEAAEREFKGWKAKIAEKDIKKVGEDINPH